MVACSVSPRVTPAGHKLTLVNLVRLAPNGRQPTLGLSPLPMNPPSCVGADTDGGRQCVCRLRRRSPNLPRPRQEMSLER